MVVVVAVGVVVADVVEVSMVVALEVTVVLDVVVRVLADVVDGIEVTVDIDGLRGGRDGGRCFGRNGGSGRAREVVYKVVTLVVGEVLSQQEKDSGLVLLHRVDRVGHVIAAGGSFKLVVHVVSS